MLVSYSPRYYADIGEGHVFPIRKFELVRDRLLGEGTLGAEDLREPQPAPLADVLLVHTEDYVARLRAGALTARELRRLGLPWSKALVRRSFLAASGTTGAARFALREGVGSNLAGGTHHAFADHGAKNYPLFKARSSLDGELRDGTGENDYLRALAENLPRVVTHEPHI